MNWDAAVSGLAIEAEPVLRFGFLVFVRVGGVMALLPAFGEQTVPVRVRLALALAFSAVVTPAVFPLSHAQMPASLAAAILAEAATGLMLGAGFRLLVLALATAGAMAAQATSLAQLFGGTGTEPQAAISNLLVVSGLAIAAASGLHVRAAEGLILSYTLFPPGLAPPAADAAVWGLSHVSRAFALAFTLAMPFLAGSLIYNVALGVINRAMPQLMVAFIGAGPRPAGGGGGLGVT
ncbi:MAG: flagellar biosynthetic protein FliR, partial [Gemmobacter sp.]